MTQSTILSGGPINRADAITIELIQPDSMPAVVRIVWPTRGNDHDNPPATLRSPPPQQRWWPKPPPRWPGSKRSGGGDRCGMRFRDTPSGRTMKRSGSVAQVRNADDHGNTHDQPSHSCYLSVQVVWAD